MTEIEAKGHISAIVEKLRTLEPYRVILFGSHAHGSPGSESDIDLLVVTNDDYLITTYEEKMGLHLKISSVLRDIFKQAPVDLIVYTKPMYEKFLALGSAFSKEIVRKGKILL